MQNITSLFLCEDSKMNMYGREYYLNDDRGRITLTEGSMNDR